MRTLIRASLACLIVFTSSAFADNQRPNVVSGVSAQGKSGSAIDVSWNSAQDNVGIDGYNIYRDDDYYITLIGTDTRYTDRNVDNGREYRYAVVAFDLARNFSIMSSTASATSGAAGSGGSDSSTPTGAPAAPQGLTAMVINDSTATLSWTPPPGGADEYTIYVDGDKFTTIRGANGLTVSTLNTSRSFVFDVVASRNGQRSGKSAPLSVNTSNDPKSAQPSNPSESSGRPSSPRNLRANVLNDSSIQLTWETPDGGAEGYNVYINDSYFATVKGRNDFTFTGLESNRSFVFSLSAFRNGEYSPITANIAANTRGDSSPPPPQQSNANGNSAVPSGYSLVFNDDFNGMSIDSTKWTSGFLWGTNDIINEEEQYYVDILNDPDFGISPFKFDGNNITIEATRTPDWLRDKAIGQRYLSGAMTTHQKFEMTYGYVEMRAMLPGGKGVWPAFWLHHKPDQNTGRIPEIDVMEQLGEFPRTIFQTYHWEENGVPKKTDSTEITGPDFTNSYHTFGMLWEPRKITWFVDGVKTSSFEGDAVSSEPMYLLMNLALGGNWGKSPDDSTPFPAQFTIDYVRAYQQR